METSVSTISTGRDVRKRRSPEFLRRILLILSVALCLGSTSAWANSVIVNTSISLTGLGLQISPASGTLIISQPVPTSTFAQAQDSTGGSASQSDPASSSASTGLADASGTASAVVNLTGTATANINLPDNFSGQASSTGQATLGIDPTFSMFGSFEISSAGGSPSPVNVTFSAPLAVDQFLQTSGAGVSASSEAIFSLLLPDLSSSPILFYDNLLTIGPSQTLSNLVSPTLTTTQSLLSDTPYTFIAALDAESSGASVPEPSSLPCVLAALGLSAVLGRRLTRKPRPDGRA